MPAIFKSVCQKENNFKKYFDPYAALVHLSNYPRHFYTNKQLIACSIYSG